jgi:hypothetical protein
MKSITWKPGTIKELDEEFDYLRNIQYSNKSHRLWKNYAPENFAGNVALTIYWNEDGEAELCSSIAQRPCWPNKTYRILNRTWKHSNRLNIAPKTMSHCFVSVINSQISWLDLNTDCELYFISRQTKNWEDLFIKKLKRGCNLSFKTDKYKYLTCSLETESTCWQKIIFNGNESLLNLWKRI